MTMKQSLFWVEPNEFSRLLERVGASDARHSPPKETRVPTPASSPPGPPAPQLPQPDARVLPPEDAPTSAKEPAVELDGELDSELNAGAVKDFSAPSGSLDERLTALFAWIRSIVDFDHAFVVDDDGLALVHEAAPLELIAASSTMAETWDSLRNRFALADDNSLSLHLKEDQRLHLLSKRTRWGRLSLGIVLQTLLSEDKLASIHAQFHKTLTEQEHDLS